MTRQLTQLPRKLRVLVLSHFSYYHTQSLRDQLVFYFGNLIDAQVPETFSVHREDLDFSHFDLLVSNVKIPDLPIPSVISSGIFSEHDYQTLARTIFTLLSKLPAGR